MLCHSQNAPSHANRQQESDDVDSNGSRSWTRPMLPGWLVLSRATLRALRRLLPLARPACCLQQQPPARHPDQRPSALARGGTPLAYHSTRQAAVQPSYGQPEGDKRRNGRQGKRNSRTFLKHCLSSALELARKHATCPGMLLMSHEPAYLPKGPRCTNLPPPPMRTHRTTVTHKQKIPQTNTGMCLRTHALTRTAHADLTPSRAHALAPTSRIARQGRHLPG